MQLNMMKCKIHRARVTDADLSYEGSISIDQALMDKANLLCNEKVDIYNCNNGARFSTYVIPGKPGEICLNGAAARHVLKGDVVIIVAYAQMELTEAAQHQPTVILVDEGNRPLDQVCR